ncbi:MAG TPA: 16S rRNA (cytidine(1402)-2'-O)-methyltransferase [Desulfobacteraceae bacterium]|jgi:16S rRNA (cytidine1402-2'-O)-methyltransferase|nr:16S rRNA (cytidine(1402)-2'-O)-methyltransferase [Desulfobacteraceae bacterium]
MDRQLSDISSGRLYIVSTPIGNVEDITLRAIRILGEVDLIAAEDTRHTARLLAYHHINTALISCHDYNERERAAGLIEKMKQGASVALVSDAGTPSVSDPGYVLVREAIASGISAIPIPGVSAAITALSVSGLPTDAFVFIGFLSKQKTKRSGQIESLKREEKTVIIYESPHRVVALIEEILNIAGDRQAAFAREMTKTYEEFIRGRLSEILEKLKARAAIKGECVLIVGGCDKESSGVSPELITQEIQTRLRSGERVSEISKDISKQYALPKKLIYEEALTLQNRNGAN